MNVVEIPRRLKKRLGELPADSKRPFQLVKEDLDHDDERPALGTEFGLNAGEDDCDVIPPFLAQFLDADAGLAKCITQSDVVRVDFFLGIVNHDQWHLIPPLHLFEFTTKCDGLKK